MVKKSLTAIAALFPKNRATRMVWIVTFALSLALLLLPETVRLDGQPHADWQQFLGRFHPLAVHLPIGLILLVPILEIVGAFRPALRESAGFVLGLACGACLGTLALGYLLAYGSGDTGTTVTRHMWGGIGLTIGLLLCLLARPAWLAGNVPRIYPVLISCVMLTLLWTAHQGGSLTHGSTYLTQYLPAPLKKWAALGAVNAAVPNSASFYSQQIHPILDANCVACHGPDKTQGGLRLDSYDSLIKGGKDGPVIIPRSADKSLLIARVTLPADNQHFMPAEGRPPLKPNEIAWIRAWIQQGASPTVSNLQGFTIPAQAKQPPIEPVGDYSKLMDEIRHMQQTQGAKLMPVSAKASDGLVLNTVDVASGFGDAQLAQLQNFAPYIVDANLARTAVTDACFDTLSKFTHLRALHLEGTAVTGSSIAKLAALSQLTYLNLSQTKITAAALAPLKSMANLRHLYLFDTPAQPVSQADETKSGAGGGR